MTDSADEVHLRGTAPVDPKGIARDEQTSSRGELDEVLMPAPLSVHALLLGFFGVVSGTEAVYYSLNGGPSGDDFTGFLSMVGGFVLLTIGTSDEALSNTAN